MGASTNFFSSLSFSSDGVGAEEEGCALELLEDRVALLDPSIVVIVSE